MNIINGIKNIDFWNEKLVYDIMFIINKKLCEDKYLDKYDEPLNYYMIQNKIYTKIFLSTMIPIFIDTFNEIYDWIKKTNDNNKILYFFQLYMKEILEWDNNTIKLKSFKILEQNKYKNNIVKILKIILNIKIIIMINSIKQNNINLLNIKFDVNFDKFIYTCYKNIAIKLHNNPYLMYHELSTDILFENKKKIYIYVKDCIKNVIIDILPIQTIIDKYMNNDNNNANKKNFDDNYIDIKNTDTKNNILNNIKIEKNNTKYQKNNKYIEHIQDNETESNQYELNDNYTNIQNISNMRHEHTSNNKKNINDNSNKINWIINNAENKIYLTNINEDADQLCDERKYDENKNKNNIKNDMSGANYECNEYVSGTNFINNNEKEDENKIINNNENKIKFNIKYNDNIENKKTRIQWNINENKINNSDIFKNINSETYEEKFGSSINQNKIDLIKNHVLQNKKHNKEFKTNLHQIDENL